MSSTADKIISALPQLSRGDLRRVRRALREVRRSRRSRRVFAQQLTVEQKLEMSLEDILAHKARFTICLDHFD